MEKTTVERYARFGPFEVDLRNRELWRQGVRLRIQRQPFAILEALLEAPGDLVTRDALRQRLWPDGTFVEFDKGLNTAVMKLREALGEDPQSPHFIETVAREGYRFVALVETVTPAMALESGNNDQHASAPAVPIDGGLSRSASSQPEMPASRPRSGGRWLLWAVVVGAILSVASPWLWSKRGGADAWVDPLAGARYTRVTDWEGTELGAAISADGKFVAFISDRDGPFDVWVSQVGGGEFLNLTKGQFFGLGNRTVRNVGFSHDGTHVWWGQTTMEGKGSVWQAPTIGGVPRPFLSGGPIAADWSPDATKLLFFKDQPGDPMFVGDRNGGTAQQIFAETSGRHNHYPVWSPDGRFVFFSRGSIGPPLEMDIWKVPAAGGDAVRVTHHSSDVAFLAWLDPRTLIYTGPREDGQGLGLWAMDVDRAVPHAVSSGLEEYISIAASADARRLVATVANSSRNLWTVPITNQVVDEGGATKFPLPSVHAAGPRFGPGYLLYLSSKGGPRGLMKLEKDSQIELWKGGDGRVQEPPAISPDGSRICFAAKRGERWRLHLMAADGTGTQPIADSLDVRGAPSWSPDGKWVAVIASVLTATPLFKVPVDGGEPVRLLDGADAVLSRPAWSPDGRFIVYSMGRASSTTRLHAVTPDGHPFPVPEIELLFVTPYRFVPNTTSLVVLKGVGPVGGWARHLDFWLLDLSTGGMRQLTSLKPGFDINSFDLFPDGKQILFERYRDNSDIVLIDLPPRS